MPLPFQSVSLIFVQVFVCESDDRLAAAAFAWPATLTMIRSAPVVLIAVVVTVVLKPVVPAPVEEISDQPKVRSHSGRLSSDHYAKRNKSRL